MGRDADSLSGTQVSLWTLTGPHKPGKKREADPATWMCINILSDLEADQTRSLQFCISDNGVSAMETFPLSLDYNMP